MVVPSDAWCKEHGFIQTFDNQGSTIEIPDYRKAFISEPDLDLVVTAVGKIMSDRGFDLKILSQCLKTLDAESAEDALLQSKNGGEVEETPIDKLKKTAKADIWMQVWWKSQPSGFKKTVTYSIRCIDAYTDKQIAACDPWTSLPSANTIPDILAQAVATNMDPMVEQLNNKFNDWFANGREISIRVKRFSDADFDLETEYEDKELSMIIEDWLSENCVGGRFNTSDATENMMVIEEVHIPMFETKENGTERAVDARYFARNLQSLLRKTTGAPCKLMTKGLGGVTLVLGGK